MNDNEARALGERCVAVTGFRAGMLLVGKDVRVVSRHASPNRLTVANDLFGLTELRNVSVGWESRMPGTRFDTWAPMDFVPVPDLRDGGTRGIVLDVVRERAGAPDGAVVRVGDSWVFARIVEIPGSPWFQVSELADHGATEAEVLVVALEAAPR